MAKPKVSPTSAPTLAELRHVSQRGQAQGEGLVRKALGRILHLLRGQEVKPWSQPQFKGASSKAKCMCQEQEAQLGLARAGSCFLCLSMLLVSDRHCSGTRNNKRMQAPPGGTKFPPLHSHL